MLSYFLMLLLEFRIFIVVVIHLQITQNILTHQEDHINVHWTICHLRQWFFIQVLDHFVLDNFRLYKQHWIFHLQHLCSLYHEYILLQDPMNQMIVIVTLLHIYLFLHLHMPLLHHLKFYIFQNTQLTRLVLPDSPS